MREEEESDRFGRARRISDDASAKELLDATKVDDVPRAESISEPTELGGRASIQSGDDGGRCEFASPEKRALDSIERARNAASEDELKCILFDDSTSESPHVASIYGVALQNPVCANPTLLRAMLQRPAACENEGVWPAILITAISVDDVALFDEVWNAGESLQDARLDHLTEAVKAVAKSDLENEVRILSRMLETPGCRLDPKTACSVAADAFGARLASNPKEIVKSVREKCAHLFFRSCPAWKESDRDVLRIAFANAIGDQEESRKRKRESPGTEAARHRRRVEMIGQQIAYLSIMSRGVREVDARQT